MPIPCIGTGRSSRLRARPTEKGRRPQYVYLNNLYPEVISIGHHSSLVHTQETGGAMASRADPVANQAAVPSALHQSFSNEDTKNYLDEAACG